MECPRLRAEYDSFKPKTGLELASLVQCPDAEACQTGIPCAVVLGIIDSKEKKMAEDKTEPETERIKSMLTDWWRDQAETELQACVPKAVEYGSTDLAVIGRAQGRLMGRDNLTHEEATELGIFFYLIGKLARWEDAIIHGRRVSSDTLHDVAVYIKMQQRNQAVGGWPFNPKDEA